MGTASGSDTRPCVLHLWLTELMDWIFERKVEALAITSQHIASKLHAAFLGTEPFTQCTFSGQSEIEFIRLAHPLPGGTHDRLHHAAAAVAI